jgi:hypothetical protein
VLPFAACPRTPHLTAWRKHFRDRKIGNGGKDRDPHDAPTVKEPVIRHGRTVPRRAEPVTRLANPASPIAPAGKNSDAQEWYSEDKIKFQTFNYKK